MEDDEEADPNHQYNPSDFPSIAISLEETRAKYELEQTRKSNIESRISAIIGLNALFISFYGLLLTDIVDFSTQAFVLLPSLISGLYGIQILRNREYKMPKPFIDDIIGYARKSETDASIELILNYRKAIKHNRTQNEKCVSRLRYCIWLTSISLLLIIVAPFLNVFFLIVIIPLLDLSFSFSKNSYR